MSVATNTFHGTRYNKHTGERCPTCGGQDEDKRKQGQRCCGFKVEQGAATLSYCTREERAGGAIYMTGCEVPTWRHLHHPDWPCYCGNLHADGTGHGKLGQGRKPRRRTAIPQVQQQSQGVELDLPAVPTAEKPPKGPAKHTFLADYVDEHGKLLYQKRHILDATGRRVRTDYMVSCTGKRKVLYRLPDVLQAIRNGEPIDIVESELCAEAMLRREFNATTFGNAGGDKGMQAEMWQLFKGAAVRYYPDADKQGHTQASRVAAALLEVGAQVQVVALPHPRFQGYDVADFFRDGHTATDLQRLIDATPHLEVEHG